MLPIRFNIDGVSKTGVLGDINLSIKDEYRNLVYVGKPRPHQVPISFIGMPEPTVADISIVDINEDPDTVTVHTNSYRNRARRISDVKIFSMSTRRALITDVINSEPNGAPIPLFYKHTISDGMETSAEILDHFMRPVAGSHFKVVVENDEVSVYHDLNPSLDEESLRLKAYFIRYVNSEGKQIFRLLNSDDAYKQITILDGIDPLKRAYTVRKIGQEFEYRIFYMGDGPFYIKTDESHQIKLKKPSIVRSNNSWYLSVTDGELFGTSDGNAEFYSIPEYHLQQFSPIEPVRFTGTQECIPVTNNIVKLPFENVLYDDDHHLEVLITDKSIQPKAGWTSKTGGREFWVDRFDAYRPEGSIVRFPLQSLQTRGISVQKAFGLLHLPFDLKEEDRVFVRAKYESREFRYLNLNLNPLHSRNMISGRAVLYCVPESQLDETRRAIFHFILDENNSIIAWDDTRLGEGGTLNPLLIPEEGETGFELFKETFPKFLILGTVSINRNVNPNEISYIDVRTKGGILNETISRNLPAHLDKYPELQWVGDKSLSARPFPGLGAFTVDVPFELLEEAGGTFSKENLEERVKLHTGLGSAAIINYHAPTPKVMAVEYDSTLKELTVDWTTVSHADAYKVYVSQRLNGSYVGAEVSTTTSSFPNSVKGTVGLSGSSSEDINVALTDSLYFYIVPLKNKIEWPESKIYSIDVTDVSGQDVNTLNAILSSPPSDTVTINAILVEA